MKKPAGEVTLSSEEAEVIMAQLYQGRLSSAQMGTVAHIIRMYFGLAFALQESKLSVKRLRHLLFGKRHPVSPEPEDASAAGQAAGDGPGTCGGLDVDPSEITATATPASPGESQMPEVANPKGGHRTGTGNLGADAYVGATRIECRHEELAVGQRCPACGRGRLYELPPGVEIRIDGHALLSAIRYDLQKLRCSACGQIFTAPLPSDAGDEKYSPRARAALVVGRYYLGLVRHEVA